MYDELVKKIRHCVTDPMHCLSCGEDKDGKCFVRLMTQAVDAIENMSEAYDKLSRHMDDLAALMPRWIPVTERMPRVMNKCDNCKNKKDWPCPNSCGYMGTCDGWEPKPMTNADEIRAMSDEELAKQIAEWNQGDCPTIGDCPETQNSFVCEPWKCWLDWLRQEGEL